MLVKAPLVGDKAEILHALEDVIVISPAPVLLECDIDVGEPESEIEW